MAAFAVYRQGLLALALIGCVASLSHGLAISLGARYVGLPFLVAAGLEFTALQRVFLTGVRPGAAGTL